MDRVEERKHFVILGGAGKMGRGIALVLLQAFAQEEGFTLTLVDVNAAMFPGVEEYLRTHMRKKACGEGVCDKVHYVSDLTECTSADVVFEAVIEDINKKVELLRNAARELGQHPYFFSNTSSIPIHLLASLSGLTGRLVGFHFYNPPPVQKLIELIIPKDTPRPLQNFAERLVEKLQKKAVYSHDIAGFIGNGHFIREVITAWHLVERLSTRIGYCDAIVAVNTLYQDWLLRPMGIFQLVDYVGVDVCAAIMKIMRTYIPDDAIACAILEKMLAVGASGGQQADGMQKPGFFTYSDGKPSGVFSLEQNKYCPYTQVFISAAPSLGVTWKTLVKDEERIGKLTLYFKRLLAEETVGALLAVELLEQSRSIAYNLVESGVAGSLADVDTVLQQGFYHLYGAEAPFSA